MSELRTRAEWRNELDAAEIAGASHRQHIARRCYFGLSMHALNEELARVEANKDFRPCMMNLIKLAGQVRTTSANVDVILAAGENFRTLREKIDAEIAEHRAERLYNLAYDRWETNVSKQRAERVKYRDRPAPRRPRRTVLVDGVRTKLEA